MKRSDDVSMLVGYVLTSEQTCRKKLEMQKNKKKKRSEMTIVKAIRKTRFPFLPKKKKKENLPAIGLSLSHNLVQMYSFHLSSI